MRPNSGTRNRANHMRARLDHFPRPSFNADVYVGHDRLARFFSFRKVVAMPGYRALLALLFIGVASTAVAQSNVVTPETGAPEKGTQEMGTPEQRQACGPDVRRFCKSVKPDDGPFAYLACLQEHREKLQPACLKVLESNGQ